MPYPKLSIIIPVFNGGHYISRCIESLINQSLKNSQIIVVDDGSRDDTSKIIQTYMTCSPNIELITHHENKGTGAARNTGLKHASGKYIAFLDADDWMDTNGYMEMVSALEHSSSDIAVCDVYTEYGSPYLSKIRYNYKYRNTITARFALRLLCKTEAQDSYMSSRMGNKVFRSELLLKNSICFAERSVWEDDIFMFLAFYYAEKVELIPSVAEHYFQRDASAMHSFSQSYIDHFINAFSELKQVLETEETMGQYAEEYYAFLDRCLNSMLDTLFSAETKVSVQRSYICYLLEKLLDSFTVKELMEYIDPHRLQRIWV